MLKEAMVLRCGERQLRAQSDRCCELDKWQLSRNASKLVEVFWTADTMGFLMRDASLGRSMVKPYGKIAALN